MAAKTTFKSAAIQTLQATADELRGTPQTPVNRTDPQTWIPERLQNDNLTIALAIWKSSNKTVNPRYTNGHWLLAQRYKLLDEDTTGTLKLTDFGRAFLESPAGEQEAAIDEREGVIKLLSLVAENGPTRAAGLVDDWAEYLQRRSHTHHQPLLCFAFAVLFFALFAASREPKRSSFPHQTLHTTSLRRAHFNNYSKPPLPHPPPTFIMLCLYRAFLHALRVSPKYLHSLTKPFKPPRCAVHISTIIQNHRSHAHHQPLLCFAFAVLFFAPFAASREPKRSSFPHQTLHTTPPTNPTTQKTPGNLHKAPGDFIFSPPNYPQICHPSGAATS